jgi:type I restriction enzyme S subunit
MGFEWKDTTVKDFCPFKYGKGLTERERVSGENLVVSSAGVIGTHSSALVNNKGIVIGRKGTVGNVTYVNKPFWAIDTAFYIEDEPKFRDLYFTYYLLKTLGLNGMNSDSAVPGLNRENAHSIKIKVPDLQTQRLIGSLLKLFDNRIDLLKENNQTLESIAQAIFKSWFVDFDPVHAKQQGIECAGIDKATADLFPNSFVESELGLIPKGWEVKAIGECLQVVDFVANGSFAALKENVTLFREPNYALYVRTTDYNSNFNGDFRFVDERAYRFLSKSFLVGDETIISNVGDVGTVFRAPKWLGYLMTLGSNAVALKNKEMPTYVYYFFKSNKGQHLIQSIITGSAQLKFNKTSLRSKSILIPSKSALDCFENITSAITEKMDTNQNGIKLLQNIRDTLLPRLISGKLDLSNIAEQIEGVA